MSIRLIHLILLAALSACATVPAENVATTPPPVEQSAVPTATTAAAVQSASDGVFLDAASVAASARCEGELVNTITKGVASSRLYCASKIAQMRTVLNQTDPANTLLVLDIDDTLLTNADFFGSDHWYEWQKSLAANDPAKPICTFDVLALTFEAGTQREVEENVSSTFIGAINLPKLLLTSRSANYRGATERELLAAGYTLPSNFVYADYGFNWQTDGRPVSYANGMLMVSGTDKGQNLLRFLNDFAHLKYQHVILLDDGDKNINSLHAALSKAGINYSGIWYRNVDKSSVSPEKAEHAKVQLQRLQEWVRISQPKRWERWQRTDVTKRCGQ